MWTKLCDGLCFYCENSQTNTGSGGGRQSIAAELPSQEAVSAMSIGGEMDIRERNWRTVLPMIMKLRGKEMLSTILKVIPDTYFSPIFHIILCISSF